MPTPRKLPLEQDVTEVRTLVMEYTVRCEIRTTIRPIPAGVAFAIDNAVRHMGHTPNVDPRSVRFRIEEQ